MALTRPRSWQLLDSDFKESVRAATTGPVTLNAAPNSIDGVSLAKRDRILVKNQTNGAQNGIYYVQTLGTGSNGVWVRAPDFAFDGNVTSGVQVLIEEGNTNGDKVWQLITDNPIDLDVTVLEWQVASGGGTLDSVTDGGNVTVNGITVGSLTVDNIQIDGSTVSSTNANGNINLTPNGTGQVVSSGIVNATRFVSNVATGTAPFTVTSTTQVANLNVANAGYAVNAGSATSATSATTAGTVTTASQPNITSVGTLSSLSVSGNVTASRLISNIATGTAPFQVTSTTQVANLNVATAGTAGTVTTAAQPNITSVGTLSALTVTGNVTVGNIIRSGGTSSQFLKADGSIDSNTYLTTVGNGTLTLNTSGTGLSGSATFTANQSGASTFTVTSNATSANTASAIVARDASGNFSAGTITATLSGSATSATTAGTVTTAAQPNITSVGTLTSLSTSGDLIVGGNLTINGTTTTVNSTTVDIDDLNITLAKGAANATVANGGGITIDGASATLLYLSASNAWAFDRALGVSGTITGTQLISNVATGTAPLQVTSTTQVANLNVATSGTSISVNTTTDESTNASEYLTFVGASGNSQALNVAPNKLSFNPSTGTFSAVTKSFVIDHPSKPGMKLHYGCLESPYHGVRLTGEGKLEGNSAKITLPDYIKDLCKQEGSTVQLTNIKHGRTMWVDEINVNENYFTVGCEGYAIDPLRFYWSFTAIRKDVPDIEVEY